MPPLPKAQRANLIPLFLIMLGVVGIENALTRYFAVAKWSEYGYWIISIVMAGFALSGVVVALWRDWVARNGVILRTILPAAMILAAAIGFVLVTINPFNPLQLQNPTTWREQIGNIGAYYAALLPFFFLAGLYISIIFVLNHREVGRVYGYDLIGAGLGAALALGLMFVVHPFFLAPVLLIPLAVAPLFQPGRLAWLGAALAGVALVIGEVLLLLGPAPQISEFKAVYAPLNTSGRVVREEIFQPRGHYLLLENFTERVDADISNNASMLGVEGPPSTWGLYRDGSRIAALPRPGAVQEPYATAALSAAPYVMRSNADVMIVGLSGGFRVSEALSLGASHIEGVETEPVLRDALRFGLAGSPALPLDPRVNLAEGGPIAVARRAHGRFDIVDVSSDFVDTAPANASGLTVEAMDAYLDALKPSGLLSVSVSIRDFPVYTLRIAATAREALRRRGVADPAAHVLVYRSAWNARVLVSPTPILPADVSALKAFSEARSFDLSWYPGIDVPAQRRLLFNDLPTVSFDSGEILSQDTDDAIANEIGAVLAGTPSPSSEAFNVRPATLDRPAYYSSLRLDHLGTLIKRLEVLPQAEIGALVNIAVLGQAIIIALLVLATPLLFRPRAGGVKEPFQFWPGLYFPALGLGFLFIEIMLIEKAAFYLSDYSSGFALVLTSMLIFSGVGSLIAGRVAHRAKTAALVGLVGVLIWIAIMLLAAEPFMLATLDQAWGVKALIVMLAAAPVSVALGVFFPLGLTQVGDGRALPWAWGLNGAFSVVATPAAALIARDIGYSWLLILGAVLYILAFLVLPAVRLFVRRPAALPDAPVAYTTLQLPPPFAETTR